MKFNMTMEIETATLLVQFTEMCRDDLVNDGTPCDLQCAIFRHTLTPPANHPPSSIYLAAYSCNSGSASFSISMSPNYTPAAGPSMMFRRSGLRQGPWYRRW